MSLVLAGAACSRKRNGRLAIAAGDKTPGPSDDASAAAASRPWTEPADFEMMPG